MSYIFMKILERRPESYDAGIAKYSAGDFAAVRNHMLATADSGSRVLDVGCGPGTFAIECAKRGAIVDAVDVNPQMLYTADLEAKKVGVQDNISFHNLSATNLDFEKGTFDVIVFSLSMSELREVEQWIAMNIAFELLKPGGKLVIADEVVPSGFGASLKYHFRRLLLLLITYFITRSITAPVREMEEKFRASGFDIIDNKTYEGGSLKLVIGTRLDARPAPEALSPNRLSEWAEVLGEIFSYFTLVFKAVPIRTGLYRIGHPTKDSPVLVTANYLPTFTAAKKHLRAHDCYLLVIDTRGINVWCAAGEGNFSAEEIHNSQRATRIDEITDTRTMILPKLSSNGVKFRDVRRLTGWSVEFGPIYARHLPEYLSNGFIKTEAMKRVRFNFADRLRVAVPFALFVAFWLVLPLVFFRNLYSPMIPVIGLGAGLIFPAAFYVLPSDRFFKKALVLGLIASAWATLILMDYHASAKDIVQWWLIIVGFTVFIGMDFSGMSPVSNYSKIRAEYYVVVPLLALIGIGYLVVTFLWR